MGHLSLHQLRDSDLREKVFTLSPMPWGVLADAAVEVLRVRKGSIPFSATPGYSAASQVPRKYLTAVIKRQVKEMEAAGCSECGADVGEFCITVDGDKAGTHPARAAAAKKTENQHEG